MLALEPVQQVLQPLLALAERQRAQVLAVGEQQIESEQDQAVGFAVRQRGLQGAEIRHPTTVEGDGLAVDQAIRQGLGLLGDGGELLRPVEPLAGAQHRLAVLDPELQAITVELDLVRPAPSGGRVLDQLAKLRLDEARHRRDLLRLGGLRAPRGCRLLAAAAIPVAVPHRARRALLVRHEGRRRAAGAERDLLQAAARCDGLVPQQLFLVALMGEFVAMLDQQPVGSLAAEAVAAHAHQHPAAAQALTFQGEFELALFQSFVGIALGDPIAAVPQLDRAAAILTFGDRPLEVAIIQRVVLDLDRQPLVVRIERGTLGHRP